MDISKFYGQLSPLLEWYKKNDRLLPWRTLWSEKQDPYTVWISEIMLQQTTIKVVEPKYLAFMEKFPSLSDLALASDSAVREAVRGLGYYRRFRLMHQCAQTLVEKKAQSPSEPLWPHDARGLLKLPGIGSYTSAAIASIAFGERIAVLDGNVERVLCRLLGLKINPREPRHKKALSTVAQKLLEIGYQPSQALDSEKSLPGNHNQAMMELGQLLCTPQNPQCLICPIKALCKSFSEKTQNDIPLPPDRKEPLEVEMMVQILGRKKAKQIEIALFERHDQAKFLKGTRGFISDWRLSDKTRPFVDLQGDIPILGTVRHSITHHRIKAHVIGNLKETSPIPVKKNWKRDTNFHGIQWVSAEKIEASLVSNLDRKAWKIFQKALLPVKLKHE